MQCTYVCDLKISFYRQYEEKQLKSQQERAKKKLALTNQESRLQNQVRYLHTCVSNVIVSLYCIFNS